MGLTLSGWLYAPPPPETPSSSSPPSSPASFTHLAVPPSSRLSLLIDSAPVAPGDARSRWSGPSAACSPNFRRSACGEEVTRAPAEQSSDGARAERGASRGLHLWEVLWSPAHRGSHAVIGVSTSRCPLVASGYGALVGGDSQSWGWELTTNQLWHEGRALGTYPPMGKQNEGPLPQRQTGSAHSVPERVLLVLDADAGTLGYVVDGDCFLGVAFGGLPRGAELFPAVSSVRGGAAIRLRYLNGAAREAPELKALCGLSVRRSMGKQREAQTDRLPLPPALQQYLLPSM